VSLFASLPLLLVVTVAFECSAIFLSELEKHVYQKYIFPAKKSGVKNVVEYKDTHYEHQLHCKGQYLCLLLLMSGLNWLET
jgi:hypothetical protein